MKLHYKFNLTSLGIFIIFSSAVVLTGVVAITKISYDLNRKLMTKEVGNLLAGVQAAVLVLEQSGVAGVESYVQRAQTDILSDFKNYNFSSGTGRLIIVRKKDGEALIHRPESAADRVILRDLAKMDSGSVSHIYEGESRFFCFASNKEWGWLFILSESTEKLLEVRRNFLESVLAVMVVSLIVGGLLILWSTNRIVGPIRQLARTAEEISHGRWGSSFPAVHGSDEISQLIDSFKKMSKNLSVTYIDLNENLIKVQKSQEDLSTEKERLAVTLRSIGDGVISTDVEGRINLINKVAEKYTGWSQEEALGQPVEKVFRLVVEEGSRQDSNPILAIIKSGGKELYGGQIKLISKTDIERFISTSGAVIFDSKGMSLGAILVFRDITEQMTMQEELVKAHKLESLGVLAGGIAHDFNNILTGILGNLSLAKIAAEKDAHLFQRLEKAESASLRARDLTTQLLTFSKGGEPVKKLISLTKVIRESSSFALAGSKCRCEFDMVEELWTVEADDGQISQVIHNLILNADQAMPNGGNIKVSTQNVIVTEHDGLLLGPGSYIKISIEDSGCGIASGALQRIFDPYYTTKENGNGLGLASAYSIVKKHLGHIHVDSEEGKGSIFNMYLPASDKQVSDMKGQRENLTMGSGRVLVVDDEEIVREVTGTMLISLGYDVCFADDGETAIHLCKQEMSAGKRFDLIITDLTIPGGMGGRELIQELLEIDPETPVIVSSGYANDPIMANFKDYGFSGVISKPFSVDQLSKMLADFQIQQQRLHE